MHEKIYLLNHFFCIQFGGKKKWTTLEHNGVVFPPNYIPHNIALKYENELIFLSTEAEEFAMIYAKYIDTDYINNKLFNKNFWTDWKKILGKDTPIKSLEGCDFSEYNKIYLNTKASKTEEDKIIEKDKKTNGRET